MLSTTCWPSWASQKEPWSQIASTVRYSADKEIKRRPSLVDILPSNVVTAQLVGVR